MIQIEFEYNQDKVIIQAKSYDSFQSIIDRYIQKSQIQLDSVYFIANGNKIKPERSLESIMTNMDKQNKKIKVLVNKIQEKDNNCQEVIIKPKDIICPKCGEICRISIEDSKINLFGCCNNHTTNGIRLLDFKDTQKVNISKIICGKCKSKNKGNSTNYEFYKCLTCKENLCILCKTTHNSSHYIIRDDQINNICLKDNEQFIKYCPECNVNTCFSCVEEHRQHKTINLADLIPNMDEIKNQLSQLKKVIENLEDEIQMTIMKLNEFRGALNIFYEINNDILNNYEMKNRNYQILENIKLITNNEIFNRLKKIDKMTDLKEKIFSIIDLYNKISSYDEYSQNINMGKEDSSIILEKQKKEINKNESNSQSSFTYFKNTLSCKAVLIGESNVGKNEIADFIRPKSRDSITSISGRNTGMTIFFYSENQAVNFEIFNTPGQEKYRALTKTFFRDANVCILVYDKANKLSFDKIRNYWINQVNEHAPKDVSKKKIYI